MKTKQISGSANPMGWEMRKMFRFAGILFLFAAALPAALGAKDGDISLRLMPVYAVPLGPKLNDGTPWYSPGGGFALKGQYDLPGMKNLSAELGLDVDYLPVNNASEALTALSIGAGLGFRQPLGSRFRLVLGAGGGWFYGMHADRAGDSPYLYGGGGLDFQFSPALNLGLGAVYKRTVSPAGELYSGLGLSMGMSYNLSSGRRGADLRFAPAVQTIYPLYYTYYDKNPLGTVEIANTEDSPIRNIRVSLSVPQFMERPSISGEFDRIPPGGRVVAPLTAVFINTIFNVTEGLKVAGELKVDYEYLGRALTETLPLTLTVQNRNAMTWDDDRKAAAFISANHPLVKGYAKNLAATIRSDTLTAFTNEFRIAMGLFTMLEQYGMQYIPDSSSPFAVLSEQPEAVDQVQFPVETLNFKAGDCDDLSVLYAALLEAAGVETALITIPGHIYVAFNLGISEKKAESLFPDTGDMIEQGGTMWIPVEITLVGQGFTRAWQTGAQEWRGATQNRREAFIPVREAWKTYTPAETALQAALFLPDPKEVLPPYRKELSRYIDRRLGELVGQISGEIRQTGGSARSYNRLGVVYAKYGRLAEAESQFRRAVSREPYIPALINLGNVLFLKADYPGARDLYARALAERPDNASALLGYIKANYELERYREVDESLKRLQALDPAAAGSVSYMSGSSGGARASAVAERTVGGWIE